MKILKLKFKNINSLAGDWEIDFTQPEFTENGIFAITGKTGSGKSSILDAISLALYGKTPRVDVTAKNNDVITRGTSDCYAEIAFEVSGKVWKATWKQERTRTKNLKPVQRVIADSEDNIVADQIKACDNKIEEILGLTFEQFTKVILLAQGSFAAFLQADKSDKGELLEQITGTEIYGEISRKVFEKNKEESQKLEILNSALGAITILSEEEILKLNEEIIELGNQKVQIDKDLQIIVAAQNRLKELDDLQKHINDAKAKLPELFKKEEDSKTTFEKAENEMIAIRQEQEKLNPVLLKVRELDTKITEKNNVFNSILDALKNIEKEKYKLSDDIQRQKNDWQKVSSDLTQREDWRIKNAKYESLVENYSAIENQNMQVQSRLNDWHAKQADFEKAAKDLENKSASCRKALNDFNTQHQSLETKIRELEDYKQKLAKLLKGKELSALQSEKENITSFGNTIKGLIDNLKNIISNQKEVEICEQSISENLEKGKELNIRITLNRETLKSLNNQIDLLQENIAFAHKVQELEDRRKNLEDGKECPLCGSTVHPYALGNLPVVDEKEQQLRELKKLLEDKNKALHTDEKTLVKAMSDRENADNNRKTAERNLSENREKQQQLRLEIKDFNIEIKEDIAYLEEIRSAKLKEWQQIDTLIKDVVQIETGIKKLRDETIPQYQQAEKSAEIQKTESETAKRLAEKTKETDETITKQAKAQYETENIAFISKLTEYGAENMNKLKNYRNLWIDNEDNIQKLNRQKIVIEGNIKAMESLFETNQKQFVVRNAEKEQAVVASNHLIAERKVLFDDKNPNDEENRLKKQISDAEQVKNAAEKAKTEANTEYEKTNAIIQENEKRLLAKQMENIVEKTPEELQSRYEEKKMQSDGLLQTTGAKKQELEANDENLKKNKKKLSEKEVQQQISDRWKRLDNLIGSADGKKYRNFAQALTFENLIVLANTQLRKMSERYILKRIDDWMNPFELSVIDKFQNYDERTAQNLSGGEKFIVSLALALGLANMASKNMKIDTMFIDEGFGTLDSDYLNVALTALSNLHGEGKLIGVISHLVELNERIVTHIEVIPQGDGHSKLKIA
jgi:exonuclease SbcC